MRVAIDATPLHVTTGGIRRYTEELTQALTRCFPEDRFVLVSDQPFEAPSGTEYGRRPTNALDRRWWLWGIQREMNRLGADVFHGTDFSVPYLPVRPAVLTLHDLSPWRNPDSAGLSARVRRRTPIALRLGLATIVITPTRAIRDEAMCFFHLGSERVRAIPLAASGSFRKMPGPERTRPFFLYAGTLEPRKNVERIVAAWRQVRDRADLVLIGRTRDDAPILNPEPGLERVGVVSDEELAAWYSGAAAVVYPSLYEGFGLPVLEAMQCGALVIASRDPAITEVADGAAVQVDATDVAGLADAMRAALDPEFAKPWRHSAEQRAAHFSWDRTAAATREVYAEAIRRFRG